MVSLRLPRDFFDQFTLHEYNLLAKRYAIQEEWIDWRFGLLNATIANVQRNEQTKPEPWRPDDFMPTRTKKQQQEVPLESPMLGAKLRLLFGEPTLS